MKPSRNLTAGLLPVAIAIVATIVFGFWYRQQAVFQIQQRFRSGRIPEVTIRQLSAGSGALAEPQLDCGGYMLFQVLDDGWPRPKRALRRAAIQFSAVDESGQTWPVRQTFSRSSLVAYIPRGYSVAPKRLTLTASARGRVLAAWQFPRLASPQRILWEPSSNDLKLTASKKHGDIALKLNKPVPSDEMWLMSLQALTYGRVEIPLQLRLSAADTAILLPASFLNDSDMCQVKLTRHRTYELDQQITFALASISLRGSTPSLHIAPSGVRLSPELLLTFVPQEYEAKANYLRLLVSSKDPVKSFQASLLPNNQPIRLDARFPLHTKVRLEEPPALPPAFTGGKIPLSIAVRATPYRKFDERTIVLPLMESQ